MMNSNRRREEGTLTSIMVVGVYQEIDDRSVRLKMTGSSRSTKSDKAPTKPIPILRPRVTGRGRLVKRLPVLHL